MRYFALAFCLYLLLPQAAAAENPLSRAAGFALLWEPLGRTIEKTWEAHFADVPETHPHHALLTYAKARGILDDAERWYPDEALTTQDALVWLLRSRNVTKDPLDVTKESLINFITRYPLGIGPDDVSHNDVVTEERLRALMQALEGALQREPHVVSYYSDDFAGSGTAFGETFDPNALTAAHRSFPQNTLVKVTNAETGQSVIVRINDRGPYVEGRDMDLSRAAFEQIGSLSNGVLTNITFERLSAMPTQTKTMCSNARYRTTIGNTLLSPGIPSTIAAGSVLTLSGDAAFRILQMRSPGRPPVRSREWKTEWVLSFPQRGVTTFVLQSKDGRRIRLRTRVVGSCS